MVVVSISIPETLMKQVDALTKAKAYAGRSEVARAALRDFVADHLQNPERDGMRHATLTIVYPEGFERRIGEIRHEFGEVVKAMMHSDTEGDCIEIFFLQGRGDRIRQFTDRLRGFRESKLVRLLFTDATAPGQESRRLQS
jgi:CopG family nickel-responsive transcriptional regulator